MKYCEKCGTELEDNAAVCTSCGALQNNQTVAKAESSTLGILSIVFGALGGWLGLLFGIIGLVKYKEKSNRTKCVVGICLFAAWIVIFILLNTVYSTSTGMCIR